MASALDTLRERGYIDNISDEAGLRAAMAQPIRFYIGFDPTANSLHVGSLLQIMVMAQLQRAGHRPIAVVGGGTGMVGDPSFRNTGRPIMTLAEIEANMVGLREQLSRYLDFSPGQAIMVNNADWLRPLAYLDFLRDIGIHFSINHMLAAEAYKTRLETGLTFLEFNYMLLQAYDFLHLHQHEQCRLQVGGTDQWANCLAGADLIRKVEGQRAFVLATPLLTTASGAKMGKTEQGAVWLDAARTPPYDYYQFWINTEDADVGRFLALFTFLPMDEVRALAALAGAELRQAKEVLAVEATALTHGRAAAEEARAASQAAFGGASDDLSAIPSVTLPAADLAAGVPIVDLLVAAGLARSRGEARRLVEQGGAYVNGVAVAGVEARITHTGAGPLLLRSGKKHLRRVEPA
ncbi:MAG: tyrosine--tRNA ligase [Chloroflexi bacterium]|nr:tyrosine--tRNA ligase [Chloroflexota bacterium]